MYGLVWGVSPPKLKKTTGPILAVLGLTTVALAFIGVLDGLGKRSFLLRLVGLVVSSVVPFVVALVASIYLPRQPTRWPELVPGALFLAVGVFGLHVVTVFWIAREVESKTDTYGAIGAALALLLWSYLLGRLITASAVINATLWQRREDRAERRAERVRMHAGSQGQAAPQGYTPPARPESAPSTASRRKGTDGRAERSN